MSRSRKLVPVATTAAVLALVVALAYAGPSGAVVAGVDVINNIGVTPVNGTVVFDDLGVNDGVVGIQCDGESPDGWSGDPDPGRHRPPRQ